VCITVKLFETLFQSHRNEIYELGMFTQSLFYYLSQKLLDVCINEILQTKIY